MALDVGRQHLLRAQSPGPPLRRRDGLGVAELGHAGGRPPRAVDGSLHRDVDDLGRGLHHRPAGFAATVSDRRKLQPGPARQLPAPARSADEPGRHLPLRPAGRVVRRRRRSGRHPNPRTDAVHAPRVRPRQPAGAAHASLSRFDPQHARCHSRRRRNGRVHARGIGLSRRGPGRGSNEHRAAEAELVGGARQLEERPVVLPGVRRTPQAAGVVRAVRCDSADRLAVLRGKRRNASARGDARLR